MIFRILFHGWEKIKDCIMSFVYKGQMKSCREMLKMHPSTSVYYGLENLYIGNNV